MRLAGPPGGDTLARLYFELSKLGAPARGLPAEWEYGSPSPEELVALASQAARYDARLLWILVQLLATELTRFDPLKLRAALGTAEWPAAMGVAFEFALRAAPTEELRDVAQFVMRRTPVAGGEQFFLGGTAFGGKLMRQDAEESLSEYRRWGYLGREEPIPKELGSKARGTMAKAERLNVLRRVAQRLGTFTVGDYLEALEGRISRRQASRDLSGAPFLALRGSRRGARYQYRAAAAREPRAGDRVSLVVGGRRYRGQVRRLRRVQGSELAEVELRARSAAAARKSLITVPAGWLEVAAEARSGGEG